jgi:hypothetical protein
MVCLKQKESRVQEKGWAWMVVIITIDGCEDQTDNRG